MKIQFYLEENERGINPLNCANAIIDATDELLDYKDIEELGKHLISYAEYKKIQIFRNTPIYGVVKKGE